MIFRVEILNGPCYVGPYGPPLPWDKAQRVDGLTTREAITLYRIEEDRHVQDGMYGHVRIVGLDDWVYTIYGNRLDRLCNLEYLATHNRTWR